MNCRIDAELVARAAALIRSGKLVAFPTETVYGLGANALDPAAVERIFQVKGRPGTSPLIVHVDSREMAQRLAERWPENAEALAGRYWPGPLTLVLPKKACVPDIVTAGLPTVGLRIPAHPLALALIREAGVPVAAPSANRFSELSPTTAGHVRKSLGDAVDLIVDGGPTAVGIESTVVSLAGLRPVLLRPGMISLHEIQSLIGAVDVDERVAAGAHPSPGMHPKHYSPRTPLILGSVPETGRGAYLWLTRPGQAHACIQMPKDAKSYAAALYETLHRLDEQALDWIAVEMPPSRPEWAGVLDRLKRAGNDST